MVCINYNDYTSQGGKNLNIDSDVSVTIQSPSSVKI